VDPPEPVGVQLADTSAFGTRTAVPALTADWKTTSAITVATITPLVMRNVFVRENAGSRAVSCRMLATLSLLIRKVELPYIYLVGAWLYNGRCDDHGNDVISGEGTSIPWISR